MTGSPPLSLSSGWMLAVVPGGLAIVGPATEISIELSGGTSAGIALAEEFPAPGARPGSGTSPADPEDRERLVTLLERHGALEESVDQMVGIPLATAIEAVRRGESCPEVIVTADEALVLPPGLTLEVEEQVLRAFVAGLSPEGRLLGYAPLTTGDGRVLGDLPDPELLERRLTSLERSTPAGVTVLELHTGRRWDLGPGGLDGIGAAEAHRLGPIRFSGPPDPLDPDDPDGLHVCVAQIAVPDLSAPGDALHRTVQGVADAGKARLVAHAEGAERSCGSRASGSELIRSPFQDLPDAVDPRLFYAREAPDPEARPDGERLWAPAFTRGGERRWVPAETVYQSVRAPAPPGQTLPSGSSGLAAHLVPAEARSHAFCELVERDAFMWTWMRRVSRELVALSGIPPETRALRDLLAKHDWSTTWVNLSLDTFPVILCCLNHPVKGLTLGAGCNFDPSVALHRATVEALVIALRFEAADERISAGDVRSPRDHLLLHRDPQRLADHGFLFSSPDEIELAEIPPGDGDLEGMLDDLGFSPLSVDLSLEVCHPYRVVRAIAPGLIPITFGNGREPNGMDRARHPLTTRDGRLVGHGPVASAKDGVPHPFA